MQCYVNFFYTAKWLSYTYILIYSFSYSFPLRFITGCWIQFPVLYSRTLLFLLPVYNSSLLIIPYSQSFALHSPTPLASISLFSLSVSLFLVCRYIGLYCILDSTYKWYHIIFAFWLVHWAWSSLGSSMSLQMALFHSLWWLSNTANIVLS